MFPTNLARLARQINFKSVQFAATSFIRCQSTAPKDLVLLDVNDRTGIATMTMNSLPVNSLNLELLSAISGSLDVLNKNNTRGMILTSVREEVTSLSVHS